MKNKIMDPLYLTVSNFMENSIGLKRGFTLPLEGVFLKMDRTVCALLLICCVFFSSNLENKGTFSTGTLGLQEKITQQYSSVPL